MSNSQFQIKFIFDQKIVLFGTFWAFFDQKSIKKAVFGQFLCFFNEIYFLRILKFFKLILTI